MTPQNGGLGPGQSGLDSTSSLEVCQALRELADEGITVVAVPLGLGLTAALHHRSSTLHQIHSEVLCLCS